MSPRNDMRTPYALPQKFTVSIAECLAASPGNSEQKGVFVQNDSEQWVVYWCQF